MNDSNTMRKYTYEGSVVDTDGNLYHRHWKASTMATSEKKALTNLAYRFKQENNIFRGVRIALSSQNLVSE